MSVEHTARHAADAGYRVAVASDGTATMSEEWQHAALGYALTQVATIATCAELASSSLARPLARRREGARVAVGLERRRRARVAVALNARRARLVRRGRRRDLGDERADLDARAVADRDERGDRPVDAVQRRVGRRLAADGDLPRVDGDADGAVAPRRSSRGPRRRRASSSVSPSRPGRARAAQDVRAGEARDERGRPARRGARSACRAARARPSTRTPMRVGEHGRVLEVVRDEERREAEARRGSRAARPRTPARVCASSAESGSSRSSDVAARARARARARLAGARRRRARPGRAPARCAIPNRSSSPRAAPRAARSATFRATVRCGKSA